METSMGLETMHQTLRKYHMLAPGDHILAGVSGGADSVALLYGLLAARVYMPLSVSVVHVNHNLRGADAERDEDFVRELCERLRLPFRAVSVDVCAYAARHGLSTEEAGRRLRYAAFAAAMADRSAQKIAVAHNRDDNAETVLMHLCRGAGLDGLCGIPPVRGPIIRPLLETPRSAIEAFLHENGIPYRTDATNLTDLYLRNRVRHMVIPAMAQAFGTDGTDALTRCAALLRTDADFLTRQALAAFEACCAEGGDENKRGQDKAGRGGYDRDGDDRGDKHTPGVALDVERLRALHPAMQTRVVREGLRRVGGLRDVSQGHVAMVLTLLASDTGKTAVLPHNLRVVRVYDKLIFDRVSAADNDSSFCHTLVPGQPLFIAGIQKNFLLSFQPPNGNFAGLCTKTFNYDTIQNDLLIRTRRPGDRIDLAGVGAKKLQDYFTDRKVPRDARDRIPLLADGGQILWIMDDANRVNNRYACVPGCASVWVSVWQDDTTGDEQMKETVSELISKNAIDQRLDALAAEIMRDFAGHRITMVCALKGAVIFMADLARRLTTDVAFDFVNLSSYGDASVSSGKVRLKKDLDTPATDQYILVVEDIIDSGHTLAFLRRHLAAQKPAMLKVCALLDKPDRRQNQEAVVDYTGFTIPDEFVVGYGLDYAQRYRNLPYIGVLHFGDAE